jgi:ankyrin repeat protein
MHPKLKKDFKHSQFYNSYQNYGNALIIFQNIKDNYNESKLKYKNKLDFLSKKINLNIFDEQLNEKLCVILNEKIKVGHNIKKYVNYSENINIIFIKAIRYNNIKAFHFLIKKGVSIHYKINIPLIIACKFGNIKIVKLLIRNGSLINTNNTLAPHEYDEYFDEPNPIKPTEQKQIKNVELPVDENEWNPKIDFTIEIIVPNPLSVACENGHFEIVKFLVKNGADIHMQYNYAFVYSCKNGHLEIVKFLFKNGADIHVPFESSLIKACGNGKIEIVKFLLEKGAYIDFYDNEPLIKSCEKGHIDIVKLLLDNGVDLHTDNDKPLITSSYHGHINIVKFLLKKEPILIHNQMKRLIVHARVDKLML